MSDFISIAKNISMHKMCLTVKCVYTICCWRNTTRA